MLEKWNGLPPDDQTNERTNNIMLKSDEDDKPRVKSLKDKEKEYGPLLKENSEIENDIDEGSSGMVWM